MKIPILLVDDERDACNMLAKLLSAWDYQTDVAYDGQAALQLLEQKRFGVAIIDYMLPGMNGVELIRRMREAQPDIAGVFLTGFTTIDVVYPAIEAGILHVMSKPADFKELVPILDKHLATVG